MTEGIALTKKQRTVRGILLSLMCCTTIAWPETAGAVPVFQAGSGVNSTIAGIDNVATGESSTSVGYKNYATGTFSTSFGLQNSATGQQTSAFGHGNWARGLYSSGVGFRNSANAESSNAFGTENTANAYSSSAFGSGNTAEGISANAVGTGNKASGESSTAVGTGNNAAGKFSAAFGFQNSASGMQTSAFGHGNGVQGVFANGVGFQNTAKAESSNAFGTGNTAGAIRSSAFGSGNTAGGENSSAFGNGNQVNAKNSSAFGHNNSIDKNAAGSFVAGNGSKALAARGLAIGNQATVGGTDGMALGMQANASAANSMALGNGAAASNVNSMSLGNGAVASHANGVALGAGAQTGEANVSATARQVQFFGTTYQYAGTASAANGTVSVGSSGKERQVQHVAAGDISARSTDAVNGSQLWATNQGLLALGDRIDQVGAGAAAIAALRPLDFDPDSKWDVAAGYGHYNKANAVAAGIFYRPDEDTLFGIGCSYGNGDTMINASISLKLGRKNHVSRSRVAMGKEIKDLREELETLKMTLLAVQEGSPLDASKLQLFPDVPENHWAYEYIAEMAGNGILEGYADGSFGGDRPMTRYEFATMLYRAMAKGVKLSERALTEFAPELERFTVDAVRTDKNGMPTIERIRIVKAVKTASEN